MPTWSIRIIIRSHSQTYLYWLTFHRILLFKNLLSFFQISNTLTHFVVVCLNRFLSVLSLKTVGELPSLPDISTFCSPFSGLSSNTVGCKLTLEFDQVSHIECLKRTSPVVRMRTFLIWPNQESQLILPAPQWRKKFELKRTLNIFIYDFSRDKPVVSIADDRQRTDRGADHKSRTLKMCIHHIATNTHTHTHTNIGIQFEVWLTRF